MILIYEWLIDVPLKWNRIGVKFLNLLPWKISTQAENKSTEWMPSQWNMKLDIHYQVIKAFGPFLSTWWHPFILSTIMVGITMKPGPHNSKQGGSPWLTWSKRRQEIESCKQCYHCCATSPGHQPLAQFVSEKTRGVTCSNHSYMPGIDWEQQWTRFYWPQLIIGWWDFCLELTT